MPQQARATHVTEWRTLIPVTALVCLLSATLCSAVPQPTRDEAFHDAIMWSLIPGGGHYYLDEPEAGSAYLGTTLSLLGGGICLEQHNNRAGIDDEVNTPLVLGLKAWELSFFTTYRSALASRGYELRSQGVDDTPVSGLFLAPFRRQNATDPMVLLAGLTGIAAAAYDSRHSSHSAAGIDRVKALGIDANREWGCALYSVDAFSLSLAAAVSEEAAWRGMLQNEIGKVSDTTRALWTTALLFGAAHVIDIHGDVKPENMVFPTLAGVYLGHLFERDDHRLSRPIAAHFWYNFSAMMTAFALDPENNPLGAQVSFSF